MDIDYTVAALMFPAIPLMMTMYSNRFHTLSALIRKIHDQYTFEKKVPPEWENQLHVLNKRTNYLKFVMGFSNFCFYLICLLFYCFIRFNFLRKIKLCILLYLYDLFDFFIFTRNQTFKRSFKISFK